jgi:hypothetical protein
MLAVSPVYTICTETAMKLYVTRSVTLLHNEAIRLAVLDGESWEVGTPEGR